MFLYKIFMKIWGYIAALLVIATVAGIIVISIKVDISYLDPAQTKNKQYSHELAENVRYFDLEFIDRELFTFKNCRIKKLRRGAFTFGAFNVLELDDLVINIPVAPDGASGVKATQGKNEATNSFLRVFSSFRTMGKRRFSGIEINNLTLNKYLTANLYVQIEALQANCKFNTELALKQCDISTNKQNKVHVSDAVIQFRPVPALFYKHDGVRKKIEL